MTSVSKDLSRHIPAKIKRRVLVEAGHRCAIHTCREIEVDVHHIVPFSKCQKHEYENLIALCPNCHRRADRGDIDRKALKKYKVNLRYAHDRFSQLEVDILFKLHNSELHNSELDMAPEEKVQEQWPSFLMLMINRILDAGYIEVIENQSSVQVFGMEISPIYISLTDKGREYINSFSATSADSRAILRATGTT